MNHDFEQARLPDLDSRDHQLHVQPAALRTADAEVHCARPPVFGSSSGRTNPSDASSSWATSSTRTASRARECSTSRRGSSDGLTPENYFGEDVAERYDESSADMFEPDVLDPAVDFLAELAGDGAALELGIGTGRIALPLAQRGVRVHGIDLSADDGRQAAREARRGADRGRDRRLRDDEGRRLVLARVHRLQHDRQPDDAGRAGRVLRERCSAPRAGRLLRDRDRRSRSEDASPGRAVPGLRLQRGAHRNRRARRREPGPDLASPLACRTASGSWCRCRSATCGRRSST